MSTKKCKKNMEEKKKAKKSGSHAGSRTRLFRVPGYWVIIMKGEYTNRCTTWEELLYGANNFVYIYRTYLPLLQKAYFFSAQPFCQNDNSTPDRLNSSYAFTSIHPHLPHNFTYRSVQSNQGWHL